MDDASPNVFGEQIEAMIKQLGSRSPAKRREAALFLGEVANADAVPELVAIYEKDRDPNVRAAAAYALGMYKAVDQALARGEEDKVVDLLTKIEEDGELGSRANIGRAIRTILALVLSLALLLALTFFSGDIKALIISSDKTQSEVIGEVRHAFDLVRNDTRTLQGELLNVISGRSLSCIAYFNNPAPYKLDSVDAHTYPDAAAIAEDIHSAQISLAAAKTHYDNACDHGAEFGATQAQETFQILLPALQSLDALEAQLTQMATLSQQTAVPPTVAATSVPAEPPTAEPTATPEQAEPTQGVLQEGVELDPTIPPEVRASANPKQHIPALTAIISDVTGVQGASTTLLRYWEDVANTGATNGCDIATVPNIPTNDTFIPEADLRVSPDLERAVQLINSGLASLRDGWVRFRFACNSRSLTEEAATRLQEARVTANAFDAASVLLERVIAAP